MICPQQKPVQDLEGNSQQDTVDEQDLEGHSQQDLVDKYSRQDLKRITNNKTHEEFQKGHLSRIQQMNRTLKDTPNRIQQINKRTYPQHTHAGSSRTIGYSRWILTTGPKKDMQHEEFQKEHSQQDTVYKYSQDIPTAYSCRIQQDTRIKQLNTHYRTWQQILNMRGQEGS